MSLFPLSVNSMPGADGKLIDSLYGNLFCPGNLIHLRPERDLDLGASSITANSVNIHARCIFGGQHAILKANQISFTAQKVDFKGRIDCSNLAKFPPADLQDAELHIVEDKPHGPLSYYWVGKKMS